MVSKTKILTLLTLALALFGCVEESADVTINEQSNLTPKVRQQAVQQTVDGEVQNRAQEPDPSLSPAALEADQALAPQQQRSPEQETPTSRAQSLETQSPTDEPIQRFEPRVELDIQPAPEPRIEPAPEPRIVKAPQPQITPAPEPEITPQPEPEIVTQPEPEILTEPEPEILTEPEPEILTEPAPAPAPAPESSQDQANLVTWRRNAVPDVTFSNTQYEAKVLSNTNNVTLHFNESQGRFDGRLARFPFEVVLRNIGIEDSSGSNNAPSSAGDPFVFAGVQIHVLDGNQPTSSHIVVGHRGSTPFTIEGKNTVSGRSFVDDTGAYTAPSGKADLRIIGNSDKSLTVYWQEPNLSGNESQDQWQLYRGNGELPGQAPAFDDQVYIGLITYAYGNQGVPFTGTADSFTIIAR